jgi:hypothetical protein
MKATIAEPSGSNLRDSASLQLRFIKDFDGRGCVDDRRAVPVDLC